MHASRSDLSPVATYDALADGYDDHFRRRVDGWEDERLAALIAPHLGTRVLDLGCGTGWLLDQFRLPPWGYVGIDPSQAMLDRLHEKHADVSTMRARAGGSRWAARLHEAFLDRFDTVTATWAAHEFGSPAPLLADLAPLVKPGGYVLLHGQAPRYARRRHYIAAGLDENQGYRWWTPDRCELATKADEVRSAFTFLGVEGVGALDHGPRCLWNAALQLPLSLHYSTLAIWRRR